MISRQFVSRDVCVIGRRFFCFESGVSRICARCRVPAFLGSDRDFQKFTNEGREIDLWVRVVVYCHSVALVWRKENACLSIVVHGMFQMEVTCRDECVRNKDE